MGSKQSGNKFQSSSKVSKISFGFTNAIAVIIPKTNFLLNSNKQQNPDLFRIMFLSV